MKIVLDVNVWISALLWGGIPGEILRLARSQQVNIFTSEALFLELETTLRRVKFKSVLKQDIVLGFHAPYKRQFTDFAVG